MGERKGGWVKRVEGGGLAWGVGLATRLGRVERGEPAREKRKRKDKRAGLKKEAMGRGRKISAREEVRDFK